MDTPLDAIPDGSVTLAMTRIDRPLPAYPGFPTGMSGQAFVAALAAKLAPDGVLLVASNDLYNETFLSFAWWIGLHLSHTVALPGESPGGLKSFVHALTPTDRSFRLFSPEWSSVREIPTLAIIARLDPGIRRGVFVDLWTNPEVFIIDGLIANGG